jgi:hypothetical protein
MKTMPYRKGPLSGDVTKTPTSYYLRDRLKNAENVRGTVRVTSHISK